MLVLSRKLDQDIVINDNITVRVLQVKGNTIRLGVDAPRDIKIMRGELQEATDFGPPNDELAEEREIIAFPNSPTSNDEDQVEYEPVNDSASSYVVSYRTPRPVAGQHNRLKELVKQLTRPK